MTAPLKVAIQMDPMPGINIDGDSSFALAIEAQERGHALWHYVPEDMSYRHGQVVARAHRMIVRREKGNHYSFSDPEIIDIRDMDVVLMRQDPPFDMAYITATHLLELVQDSTLVVNDPVSVRNAPEKLFVTKFADLMPPTLITRRLDEVQAFRKEHGEIIVKPLFGNGGEGIFHLKEDDSNLGSLMEMFTNLSREPVMVQRFLPAVREGDKRIILIDGEPLGAINRVPARGEVRSNLVAGGRAEKTELTPREQEICDRLKPELKKQGLLFVGIDVIDGWLTEVNVTSPTGILAVDRFNGTRLQADIWNAIEAKVKK